MFEFLHLRIWSSPCILVSTSGFFYCSSDFSCVRCCFQINEYIVYFFMTKAIILHSQAENRLAYGRLSTGMGKLKYFGVENSFSYDV